MANSCFNGKSVKLVRCRGWQATKCISEAQNSLVQQVATSYTLEEHVQEADSVFALSSAEDLFT